MKYFLFIGVLLMTSCTRTIPPYVCIDDPLCINTNVLREPAKTVEFPLNEEVCQALADLEAKYDNEENIAGLAAPQIGYPYKIIVFAVPDDPNLKKFRNDLVQTMPKTIWINPTYTPLSNEKRKDMEGCFSIKKYVGQVERYTSISYCATTVDGKKITGEATGFLARVIQHEVDHLNGILCLDSVKEDERIDKEEYIAQRKRIMEQTLRNKT